MNDTQTETVPDWNAPETRVVILEADLCGSGASGRRHDEKEGGQEEVYIVLSGSGVMRIDGQDVALVPGRWLRVDPNHIRMPIAGSEGLTLIMVGGTPGRGYVPRDNL